LDSRRVKSGFNSKISRDGHVAEGSLVRIVKFADCSIDSSAEQPEIPIPACDLQEIEAAMSIHRLVDDLDPQDQDIVDLRFYGGLTFREIADAGRLRGKSRSATLEIYTESVRGSAGTGGHHIPWEGVVHSGDVTMPEPHQIEREIDKRVERWYAQASRREGRGSTAMQLCRRAAPS
jgi:hypothetical protein